MATTRTPEQVSREIAREREQLASAVAHLRTELKQAADVKALLKAKAPTLAAGAGVLVAAIVAKKLLQRRAKPQRSGREWLSFGRFTLIER